MAYLDKDHGDFSKKMAGLIGPEQIDQQIRQAIHFCWITLPKKRRTPDEVENPEHPSVHGALPIGRHQGVTRYDTIIAHA